MTKLNDPIWVPSEITRRLENIPGGEQVPQYGNFGVQPHGLQDYEPTPPFRPLLNEFHGGRWRTSLTLTDGANTTITWDTEEYDTDEFLAIPGTTIVIPTGLGGIYLLEAYAVVSTATAAANPFYVLLDISTDVNGQPDGAAQRQQSEQRSAPVIADLRVQVACTVRLAAGNQITVSLQGDSVTSETHSVSLVSLAVTRLFPIIFATAP